MILGLISSEYSSKPVRSRAQCNCTACNREPRFLILYVLPRVAHSWDWISCTQLSCCCPVCKLSDCDRTNLNGRVLRERLQFWNKAGSRLKARISDMSFEALFPQDQLWKVVCLYLTWENEKHVACNKEMATWVTPSFCLSRFSGCRFFVPWESQIFWYSSALHNNKNKRLIVGRQLCPLITPPASLRM